MKMAIVVRKDLGMSAGKMAGQVGHAASRLIWDMSKMTPEHQARINDWFYNNIEKKVVMKVNSEAELLLVYEQAKTQDLDVVKVFDAGLTQIEANTLTCIGIGPDTNEKIDAIIGNLKLY